MQKIPELRIARGFPQNQPANPARIAWTGAG